MNSTSTLNQIEPDDVLVARADERLAHAYEQIARADEQLGRVTEKLSKMEDDAAHLPSSPGRRPSRGRPALRGLTGLLLASCIVGAAFVSQSSYGDAAKPLIARWAPQLASTSSVQLESPGFPAQPGPSTFKVAAVDAAAPQPTPAVQGAPQDVAPTAAPVSSEVMELLQAMARDLANVEQGIERLKASQAQMASDNVKEIEQLKASQEQMRRLIAKASEQDLRPKTSAPPARPIATAAPKPAPTLPSPEARARPQTPMQLQPRQQ
ncbi:MAG: hypothetical protein HY852_07170 [Bradyrhizobium sp.]|uniref:hypothetical protein n=1 Tax=Bradyrhizobium sp. TaxID=376 RepID=UPI0025BF9273|nr:hypothetical protein [Bradyrhizobium sp.]MBI5261582.1 hypothetical protein [Bradyrhizobium sp.]